MPDGHGRFSVLNRTGNPFVSLLLRSPLHGMLDDRLLLITVTGRRSGREHTFPVGYKEQGDRVRIGVGWPERKVWWRNLRGGAPVRLRIRGEERSGRAEVQGDESTGVTVEIQLD